MLWRVERGGGLRGEWVVVERGNMMDVDRVSIIERAGVLRMGLERVGESMLVLKG